MRSEKQLLWLEISEFIGQKFSTCSRRQYGAVIVGEDGRVVSIGYNGGPQGFKHCKDGGCPRALSTVPHGSVYDNCIAVHAEANALLYGDISLRKGATLIVNGPPCYGCAKLIAGSGLSHVISYEDKEYADIDKVIDLFNTASIKFTTIKKVENG